MNRLIVSGFVTIAVLAAATTMLRSHSTNGLASSQQRYTTANVNKLPIEEFEDMSFVYSHAPRR